MRAWRGWLTGALLACSLPAPVWAQHPSLVASARPLVTLSPRIEQIEPAPPAIPAIPPTPAAAIPVESPASEIPSGFFPSARRLFGKDSAVSSATANPAPALPAAEPSSNILKSSWQSLRPTPASEATPYSPPPELIPPPPSPTAGGVMMPDQTCAPTTQEVTPASGRKLPSVRMPHLRALFGG